MKPVRAALLLAFLAAAALAAHGQTLRPRIALVSPAGGQRGTTVAVTFTGTNLGHGTALIVDGPGLTVKAFTPEPPPANAKNPDGKIVARVEIAPDAPLGRHPLRVLTPLGPSEIGYFVVGEWPEAAETEPNNVREQAQTLAALPATLNGRSDGGEDVDVFRVTIPQGERFVFAASAGGIGSALEPVLTLRDAAGNECAFAAALRQPDAVLTFTAPRTGDYFLALRDLRYVGGPSHFYRLTVGKVPRVTSVFPLGGPAGATVQLTLSGDNLPAPPQRAVFLPAEPSFAPLPLSDVGNGRLDVGTLPEAFETEPNDLPATAQRVTPPVTINGRVYFVGAPKPDGDGFRFTATKGQVFSLEVIAARLGSPLDAVLRVLDTNGKELAANDDARGRDAALTFTAPEAGEYVAQIRDLNGKGGPAFGYRLRIAPAVPDFALAFSPDCLAVAPGDRAPFTVTATRQNGFDGDIALTFDSLPQGVRLLGTPCIVKGQNAITLLATADAGAALSASPLRVTGTATVGQNTLVRRAESRERNYVKNNDKIEETTRPVPLPLVAVAGPPDLIVTTTAEPVTLMVGKTAELKVSVQRTPGFTAKIPLIVRGLPPGVSVTGTVEIPENKNEATLMLKAEASAAVGETMITILGRSVVDELHFGDHAALPITLAVAKEDPVPTDGPPSAAKS